MAVLPQVPYPTASAVMNRARSFVNDSYLGGKGRILTNVAPFTAEYLNSALEELQDRIRNNGVITLTKDNVIITPIPPLAAPDASQQILLAYTGLYVNNAWLETPVLPGDVVSVEVVWERQTGSGLPFVEMKQPMEGLPSIFQGPRLRLWEYRQDGIAMPGATVSADLRLRYRMKFGTIAPDVISPTGNDSWNNITIGILCSTNVLASIVAYVYARARGAQGAPQMALDAERHMRLVTNRYVRRGQGIRYNRKAYGADASNAGNSRSGNMPY
jgi:hypothetical protein